MISKPRPDESLAWVERTFGYAFSQPALCLAALTHRSAAAVHNERLEFLGDRVLGLLIAEWLFEEYPNEPEGKLSARLNSLVSGESCAEIGRAIGVPAILILGKQARDDGAQESDNVVGDVVEALIGALFREGGMAAARSFVRTVWEDMLEGLGKAPKHPKSQLQEWAAARQCRPPVYTLEGRDGPQHAPRFTVLVEVGGKAGGSARAEGSSKQEAETAAAAALIERLAG